MKIKNGRLQLIKNKNSWKNEQKTKRRESELVRHKTKRRDTLVVQFNKTFYYQLYCLSNYLYIFNCYETVKEYRKEIT